VLIVHLLDKLFAVKINLPARSITSICFKLVAAAIVTIPFEGFG
jgi:hypothetical protein